jgi:hypothetical protein
MDLNKRYSSRNKLETYEPGHGNTANFPIFLAFLGQGPPLLFKASGKFINTEIRNDGCKITIPTIELTRSHLSVLTLDLFTGCLLEEVL